MNILFDLNWLAVLVSTIVAFALGAVWYGPIFGNGWVTALGKSMEDVKPSAKPFLISFLTTLITCIGMASLIVMLEMTSWLGGACLGLIVGIAFITCSNISDGSFNKWAWESVSFQTWKLIGIQSGYRTVYCVIMGVILALWQ